MKKPFARWRSPIPCDCPPDLLRDALLALLRDCDCGQREAARLLAVDERTLRRWVADPASDSARAAPWASVELLRRLLIERTAR